MKPDDQRNALTPPMGWNSWDVYGASVNEAEVLENATYLAEFMRDHGWQYVVVDIQWYEPTATSSAYHPFAQLTMDDFSRLTPAVNRFPSAAGNQGFAPLAAKIHDMGLKFGIHAMRGIPRQAVHQDTPILNTALRARDVAASNSICVWNTDMYGVNPDAPGAQEYYDSVFALYASWGVDFVKMDDALLPYAEGEIELMRNAITQCGRPIVLSLSCGPLDLSHADHVYAHADTWRMTGDFWDSWHDLVGMFDFCHTWSAHVGTGHWPDADMLPVGELALRSGEHGVGRRWTRLTHDEQLTMLTLWCIFRSPLMVGCNLPANDAWTLDLLTNDEVLAVHRSSHSARQAFRRANTIAWVAKGDDDNVSYLAIFNLGFEPAKVAIRLSDVGIPETVELRDLWCHDDIGLVARSFAVDVPVHGARLLKASRTAADAATSGTR
jgi:alpha-galactosidase